MIDLLETFDNPTTSYDRAFAENVLDSLMLVITIPNPIHNALTGTLCSEVLSLSFAHEYSSNGVSSSSQMRCLQEFRPNLKRASVSLG